MNQSNTNWVFVDGCERFNGTLSNVVRHALERSNSKARIHHQAGQVVQHGWYWVLTINSRRFPYSVPAIVPMDVATELLLSQLGANWADAGLGRYDQTRMPRGRRPSFDIAANQFAVAGSTADVCIKGF